MLRFLTLLVLTSTVAALGADKGEIKRFRFQRHAKQDFERLVMEFGGNGKGATPNVKVTPQSAEKNVQIAVEGFSLVGAIPEAAMNESFGRRSKYLGSLALNTDKANSLFIKANLKDSKVQIDAFWLDSPSRLVVDAFPASSPRAAGPAVLANHRVTASEHTAPKAAEAHEAHEAHEATPPAPTKKKAHKGSFVCYPASAQVVASTSYEDPATKKGLQIETDGAPVTGPTAANQNTVACFPQSSKLKAKIKVQGEEPMAAAEPAEKGPKGPDEPKRPSVASVAPVSPTAPGRVNTPSAGRHISSGPHHPLPAPAEMGKVPAPAPPEATDDKVANKDGGDEPHEAPEQN